MKKVYLLLSLLGFCISSFSQISFEKNYGTDLAEESFDVVQTADNGYVLVSSSEGYVSLLRLDEYGVEQWRKNINSVQGYFPMSMEITSDNGFIVCGFYGDYDVDQNIFLIKTDSNGEVLWEKTLGTTSRERAYSVKQTSDGGYAIAGYIDASDVDSDGFLIKTDASGNETWTQYFGGSSYDFIYSMTISPDNGYVLCGQKNSGIIGSGNAWIVKANSSGVTEWETFYPHPNESTTIYLFSVDITTDNAIITGGFASGIHVAKLSLAGDTLWTKTLGDWQYGGNDLAACSDGSIISVATKQYFAPEVMHTVLIKTDANGNKLWEKEYGSTNSAYGYKVKIASDNGYFVCGKYEYNSDEGIILNTNDYLLKTNQDGEGCFNYLDEIQEICMVTIDPTTGKNKVIWSPSASAPAASYNVYKETTEGFEVIGNVPATSLSEFVDLTSNPGTHSDKYKVSIIDTCGVETATGDFHKTIHLNVSPATPSGFALTWDHYQGFTFSKYRIFRGTSEGTLVQIDSIISSNFTYTDVTAPDSIALYYQVAAVKPVPCYSSSVAKDVGGPFSQSVSNLEDNGLGESVDEISANKNAIKVFPNPSNGISNISFKLFEKSDVSISILNLMGEVVFESIQTDVNPGKYTKLLSTKELDSGMYLVRIKLNNQIYTQQLVISK
ncbi:MAG: T9SS type A sorting domain-containing protein [Bacteroidales bacterium]|nr:T9SS type A sorting domain-containing protein [Bacteroidales bacterium]